VSITLTLQLTLFTELTFTFDFPYVLFFTIFAMSLGVSVLGSWIPARSLKAKDIASALKNM
jgi:ABC-type antimicrobial peptide transport system permease subunit